MHAATLMGGAEHLGGRRPQALVVVGHDQPNAAQATIGEGAQERLPEGLGFRGAGRHAQDLAPSVGVDPDRNYDGHRHDPPGLPDLQIRRVDPQIRPGALDRP